MSNPDLGYFYNPTARKNVLDTLSRFVVDRGVLGINIKTDRLPLQSPDRVLICGGEGTNRFCTELFASSDRVPLIGITAGGTRNGIFKMLVQAGHQVNLGDFFNYPAEDFYQFRPAYANKRLFLGSAETGSFGKHLFDTNELFRGYIPRSIRLEVAGIAALLEMLAKNSGQIPTLERYLAYKNRWLKDQDLVSDPDSIIKLSVENDTRILGALRLGIYLTATKLEIPYPKQLLRIEQAENFLTNFAPESIALDGDLFDENQPVKIAKADFAIPLIAVRTDQNYQP